MSFEFRADACATAPVTRQNTLACEATVSRRAASRPSADGCVSSCLRAPSLIADDYAPLSFPFAQSTTHTPSRRASAAPSRRASAAPSRRASAASAAPSRRASAAPSRRASAASAAPSRRASAAPSRRVSAAQQPSQLTPTPLQTQEASASRPTDSAGSKRRRTGSSCSTSGLTAPALTETTAPLLLAEPLETQLATQAATDLRPH